MKGFSLGLKLEEKPMTIYCVVRSTHLCEANTITADGSALKFW